MSGRRAGTAFGWCSGKRKLCFVALCVFALLIFNAWRYMSETQHAPNTIKQHVVQLHQPGSMDGRRAVPTKSTDAVNQNTHADSGTLNVRQSTSSAVYDLLQRIFGENMTHRFEISIQHSVATQCILYKNRPQKITIQASAGVDAAYALHYLLRQYLNSSVGWGRNKSGYQLAPAKAALSQSSFSWLDVIPVSFAPAEEGEDSFVAVLTVKPLVRLRYNFNVCTFGYSAAFWSWEHWEQEIDWMALRGINLPLAFVGQEHIWLRLWTEHFNLTRRQVLEEHFTGPAFFPWHWMGNLKSWAGPVDEEWVEKRRVLQHKILNRMRSLGMSPVLPAFAGHVPLQLRDALENIPVETNMPDEKRPQVRTSSLWMGFDSVNSGMLMVDPSDPRFSLIGSLFMELQTKEYGPTDYYNADTFNEMLPPTMNDEYLASAASSVVRGIRSINPQGKWLLQGWLFLHHRHLWTQSAVRAYLHGAGANVLVLDLAGDIKETWLRHDAFYGHDFVWCMLHNFGGRRGIYGNLPDLFTRIPLALEKACEYRRPSGECPMVGLGLSMEAVHHNPIMYDALTDQAFAVQTYRTTLPDDASVEDRIKHWLELYTRSRFNLRSRDSIQAVQQAFERLVLEPQASYSHVVTCCPAWSIMSLTPFVSYTNDMIDTEYHPQPLVEATAEMLRALENEVQEDGAASEDVTQLPRMLFIDTIDFVRQVVENIFIDYHLLVERVVRRYQHVAVFPSTRTMARRFTEHVETLKRVMLQAILDVDAVLSLDMENFGLCAWLLDAAEWATPPSQHPVTTPVLNESRMLFNAKNLITLWGDGFQGYPNYAAKAFAGEYRGLYYHRWMTLLDLQIATMEKHEYSLSDGLTAQLILADIDTPFCLDDSHPDQGGNLTQLHDLCANVTVTSHPVDAVRALRRVFSTYVDEQATDPPVTGRTATTWNTHNWVVVPMCRALGKDVCDNIVHAD